MSDQPPPRYKVNDVVWVKFRSMWWPGVVCDVAQVPPQNLRQLRRPPFAVVRFFGERTFEFIKNPNGILPYRCPQKFDFIKKGLALFRKDYGYANKFPSDVQLAEKRTGGDARIFERDDEFTLHPIDAKTAKLLAQQRAERGLPMPGEGDTASLSELSTLTPPDAPPDPLDTSGSEYSQSYYGPDDDSTYHEDSVRDEMESERTEKEKEKVEKERERAAKEREWMERKRDRAAKERERVEKERERAEMEILSAQMEIEVPPEERRMRLRAEIPFTEEEIKEVREINKVIDSMDLAEQMRLLGQIQLREEMRRKQMEAQAREHPQEYSLPHHYDEFTNVLGSVRAMSLPSMPKGVKVYECSHHPEHARVQSELVHGIRSNKSLSPTSAYRQEYEAQQNYNQFVPLVDSVPSTSRASMPSTSRGFKGQDHLKYQDPMPSTSKTPSSSRASVPATSRSSMQSNSRLSLPSTSRASMPSTSRESIQSPPRLPMPSTSRQAISSSTINCECPDHKAHVTFKLPVSPTSSPPNSSQPRPSTSREPMPSTSRKSTSPKSREQIPSTSRRESKSTSRASTSTSKAPKSMGELEEIFSRVPYQEAREYKQSISDIYKLLQSPRHHGRHAPLRGYIPPVAAQERKPTPGKKTSPSSDTKKKRGRKKKNVFGPPAPGTSRLKGESHIHDMDIYRDIEERMAAMPDYTDPNTPLPLYLRPESIRRPKKPVPPGMPPSNKMHPIPEKEGIYKCHLCKYSCGRVNNIISHIKLHNYGKNINDIIRKNYLNYIKRLTLDEKEIITVRDSSDEEEEEKEEEGEGEEEEDTVPLEDEALSFSNTRIICDPEPDTPRRRMRPKSPIRNLFKMQIIPVYSKVESQNKKLPTTSRDALLQTRAAINKSKRSTLPIETRTEQFPVNRDLPSTSRAAQSPQPSTSKAATPQSPMPSTSKSATTQFSSHSGENRDNEGSTSSSSSEPELFLDKVWRMIPQQFLEAEQRTMIRMPPIPLVNIPIRRPCIQSDPVRYLHSWQRLPGLPNSLHYLPKAPKFTLPFPILIPYKRKLPQDQLPQSKKFQQTPQQSQRLAGKKRSYQDITKQKTDNENVREILKDWDDDDTTNNPIPSTSTQNLSEEQHPIRLEDAVGMLHQMHEEKKSNDDDDESPQRKVRNIPKKDRNRPPDDEPEKPNDNVLIIEDIQIIPPETKCIDQQPSTSKETDKEDNNSANEMETEVNVTNDDNTEIKCMSDSKDENIEVINTETDENIEDINTETDDHEEKLDKNAKNCKDSESTNEQILQFNSESFKNTEITTDIEKLNKNNNSNSVQIIENIQILPIKALINFSANENKDTVENITNTDKILVQEIVEKINEVNERIIEKNIAKSEENTDNNIETPKVGKNISVLLHDLKEDTDKESKINSNENESEIYSDRIKTNYESESIKNIVIPSDNIPESSNNTIVYKNMSEKIPQSSEDNEDCTRNLPNLEENLTDNFSSNIKNPNFNSEVKNKEDSSIYTESSLDIAIRDLITPFEPKKKLPTSRKAYARYKRGEIQSIRKSSRKSDNIYKILGREITTPSPSPANMATNDIDCTQQTNTYTSAIDDSSCSATEITQKSGSGKGRRSKKLLEKDISIESEKSDNIEVTVLKTENESIENIVEQSVEKEINRNIVEQSVEKEEDSKTILNQDQEEKILGEKQPIENLKSSRKLRKTKHEDRRKYSEKEEIPKIVIKSPKNSNENPKIIKKISPEKQIKENSPKIIPKLILKSHEDDKASNDVPTSSTKLKLSEEILVEEKQEITVQPKSAISCFDFNEDEEDNEIILTPLNKLKKKYMSPPDKYKDEIDNKKNKETERKDQLLTVEIENILNTTKVPELKQIETIAETSIASTSVEETLPISVPTSNSFDSNSQDVKGLPIKERGKRFFKSRNRPKTDENIITISNVVVSTDSEDLKEIKSTNLNQNKCIADINTPGDNITDINSQNNENLSKTEKASIEMKTSLDHPDNTIKSLEKSTIENVETNLLSKTTSENELFIAETLLSFPNTVTETTSTLRNLENINLTEDQQVDISMTEKLIHPTTEKRTQIRVKSLEKLNQQFEDSLLQEKDIGKPVELEKPGIPLEHITRRRRSHLKITPRKRVLQQPVKLETNTTNVKSDIVTINMSPKSDDTLNISAEKKNDEPIHSLACESKISETKTDNNKINEESLDTVQIIDKSPSKLNNDDLTSIKTKVTTESESLIQQYEENFVEKYMKDSRIFDLPTEKIEKDLNKSLIDNKNITEVKENLCNVIESPSDLINSEKKIDSVILEPSQSVTSTENLDSKKLEIDNEQNLPTSSSSSASTTVTPSTQSISDIRSFRPRRKTSNKRSPSFSSEYPSNRRTSIEFQGDVENKFENIADCTVSDELKIIVTSSTYNINDKLDTITPIESHSNINDNLDTIKATDKLTLDKTRDQQDHQHQLSPTIEKIQINVDLANPLTTQIAKIFASNTPVTKITDNITSITPIITKLSASEEIRSATIKRKSTIEEEIPMFLIEKTKSVNEQKDDTQPLTPLPDKIQKGTGIKLSPATSGYGQILLASEKSEISISPINKTSQFLSTNKNTLGSGKLIITQLRDTTSEVKSEQKQEQSDISNMFDFTNMPILIANESTLPYIAPTTATTISQAVTLSISTTSPTTTSTAMTAVKRQGRGRPRKILQTTIISTTPITTLSPSSIPKYTSTSQQTFNKPVLKNMSSYTQQQVQKNNSNNINNYPIVHQTHTQQILDSQNYNLLHSASNNSGAGKEVGIDSKGNRFILIKQGNSQKMVKQSIITTEPLSPTDINKPEFSNLQTKPLQQQSPEMSNINVISSEVILPPKSIKNPTTNILITKRSHQPEQQSHQPPDKKMNLLGQSGQQFVITSKGAVIQSQNIQTTTTDGISSQIISGQAQQQTHIASDSQMMQQHPSTSLDISQQQMFTDSNINIQENQPPPLTKGKITSISQQHRGRKRKNDNLLICYNENQIDMPPLTAIQQNSPSTSTDLKNFSDQQQEQDIKKLKLLEQQIPTTHSIDNVANVANQLVSDIDNTSLPVTQGIADDELQTNKIMAVPATHFGIPGSAYYLCSLSPEGDYLPIDSQKLYLDPDVNQLVPLTCLSKNSLATVLASEEAAAAQVQHTAIVLQTDDTDALIEETTEIEQSEIEEEISAKHSIEVQLLAAQQQVAIVAEQQKIEKRQIIDNGTVLIDQTPNRQYVVESNTGTVETITDNIVGATVGATATASTDAIDNIICLDIDENPQQVITIDESSVITDISGGANTGIPAPTTSAAITPVAAENLLTAEDVSGFLGSDQSIVINVDGQQLILDQQSFLALAATGGESAQLETAEGQTYILSREFLAALGIGGGGVGSTGSSNDGRNVNNETQILLHESSELSGTNHDILAAALAGTEVYYQQQQQQADTDLINLQIETNNGIVQQLVGEETLTFQHLTPPVTAQTNETSALLTQPPIMSALEVPSNKKLNKSIKMYHNNKSTNELTIDDGNIISNIDNNNSNNRLLTTVPPQNLDDCIAFIGVSTQSSTVPSSLELPITITNPAIAPPKNSTNPIDDTIFNTKGLGVPNTTIGSIVAGPSSSSSSQISPHLITCNGEQELQYELFTTTQTTSQQKSTTNSQNDDEFQSNFDDPTR